MRLPRTLCPEKRRRFLQSVGDLFPPTVIGSAYRRRPSLPGISSVLNRNWRSGWGVISSIYQPLQADGSVHWLASREEIGRYFQGIVDGYRRDGCRSCRYEDLAVMPVGARGEKGQVTVWPANCPAYYEELELISKTKCQWEPEWTPMGCLGPARVRRDFSHTVEGYDGPVNKVLGKDRGTLFQTTHCRPPLCTHPM